VNHGRLYQIGLDSESDGVKNDGILVAGVGAGARNANGTVSAVGTGKVSATTGAASQTTSNTVSARKTTAAGSHKHPSFFSSS